MLVVLPMSGNVSCMLCCRTLLAAFDSMMKASQFVQMIEQRQGTKIGCIEEVAYRKGYINKKQLHKLAKDLLKSGYGRYLMELE